MSELIVDGVVVESFYDFVSDDDTRRFVGEMYHEKSYEVVFSDAEILKRGKVFVRKKIVSEVGDISSILGTVSDAAQLVMCELAECGDLLESAGTMNDVNAVGTRLKSVFGRLLSDDVRLTVGVKGKENIVEDVAVRSTAVSDVLLSIANE